MKWFNISSFYLFRQQGFSSGKDDVIQVKEAYKWIIHPLISEELGVPVDGKASAHIISNNSFHLLGVSLNCTENLIGMLLLLHAAVGGCKKSSNL